MHMHIHRHSHLMEYVMYSACDAHRVYTKVPVVCARVRLPQTVRRDEERRGGRKGGRERAESLRGTMMTISRFRTVMRDIYFLGAAIPA
jgi:hypothetical protein